MLFTEVDLPKSRAEWRRQLAGAMGVLVLVSGSGLALHAGLRSWGVSLPRLRNESVGMLEFAALLAVALGVLWIQEFRRRRRSRTPVGR